MSEELDEQVSGVAALADPVRRRLYEHVAAQSAPVSRDQAAAAAGIKRALAAFHLDKLVDEGLLEVEYRRLTGRTGPGAGRPAKLYRRSQRQFDVTLPPREYDLAGHILAAAVERAAASGGDVVAAVREIAFDRGRQLAAESAESAAAERPRGVLEATLARHGYQPTRQGGEIVLRNCPFDVLARDYTQLVCGMNLALCEGVVDALGAAGEGVEPRLEPHDRNCCVRFSVPPP